MNSLTWSDFACSRNDIFIYLEAVFMHKKKQQQKKLSGKKKKKQAKWGWIHQQSRKYRYVKAILCLRL